MPGKWLVIEGTVSRKHERKEMIEGIEQALFDCIYAVNNNLQVLQPMLGTY